MNGATVRCRLLAAWPLHSKPMVKILGCYGYAGKINRTHPVTPLEFTKRLNAIGDSDRFNGFLKKTGRKALARDVPAPFRPCARQASRPNPVKRGSRR